MTASLCGECGGRLASHRCVDCGTNHESLQQWANRQIVEHRSRPTITPLSTVDHDFCDGTGAPDRPGACRPEFYEQCVTGSDGKCTRWSHYHYPEVKS